MDKEFVVFRAGKYPQGNFDQAYLDKVVQAFDPKNAHEPPLTLDHAEQGPAYGWVKSLRRVGGGLLASFRDVVEGLKENKQWKKPSAAFYPDRPELHHVTLLGAKAPQVKGLAVEFEAGVKPICFGAEDEPEAEEPTPQGEKPPAKEKPVAGAGGGPEGEGDVDPKQLQEMINKALAPQLAAFGEKLEALQTDNKKLREQLEASRRERSRGSFVSFSETVEKAGLLAPADTKKPGLAEFADALLDVEFEYEQPAAKEGEEPKRVKTNARAYFEDWMGKLSPRIPTEPVLVHGSGAQASGRALGPDGKTEFQVHIPQGSTPEEVKALKAVEALAQKEKITFAEAARRLDEQEGFARRK